MKKYIPYVACALGLPCSFAFRFFLSAESFPFASKLSNLLQILCCGLLAYLLFLYRKKKFFNPETAHIFENVAFAIIIVATILSFFQVREEIHWLIETLLSISMGIWFSVIDLLETPKKNTHRKKKK